MRTTSRLTALVALVAIALCVVASDADAFGRHRRGGCGGGGGGGTMGGCGMQGGYVQGYGQPVYGGFQQGYGQPVYGGFQQGGQYLGAYQGGALGGYQADTATAAPGQAYYVINGQLVPVSAYHQQHGGSPNWNRGTTGPGVTGPGTTNPNEAEPLKNAPKQKQKQVEDN